MENLSDPRCDGCEFQHPFVENMLLNFLDEKVLCKRNINLSYYKDGKRITGFEIGHGLMICHRYRVGSGGEIERVEE